MQFSQSIDRAQLPLLYGTGIHIRSIPAAIEPELNTAVDSPESFSELALRGSPGNCLLLLAPILRELSQQAGDRWLTLIDAPVQITQAWLREAGLKREVILLLKARSANSALELACEALRRGRSHTVISWFHPLAAHSQQMLSDAALQGESRSLNIRLG
jgi:cell division inhibitor SulA